MLISQGTCTCPLNFASKWIVLDIVNTLVFLLSPNRIKSELYLIRIVFDTSICVLPVIRVVTISWRRSAWSGLVPSIAADHARTGEPSSSSASRYSSSLKCLYSCSAYCCAKDTSFGFKEYGIYSSMVAACASIVWVFSKSFENWDLQTWEYV